MTNKEKQDKIDKFFEIVKNENQDLFNRITEFQIDFGFIPNDVSKDVAMFPIFRNANSEEIKYLRDVFFNRVGF